VEIADLPRRIAKKNRVGLPGPVPNAIMVRIVAHNRHVRVQRRVLVEMPPQGVPHVDLIMNPAKAAMSVVRLVRVQKRVLVEMTPPGVPHVESVVNHGKTAASIPAHQGPADVSAAT
jgi:primosomal replication protein N